MSFSNLNWNIKDTIRQQFFADFIAIDWTTIDKVFKLQTDSDHITRIMITSLCKAGVSNSISTF
jgi:hypothetical protein